jgi:hypothetical protein
MADAFPDSHVPFHDDLAQSNPNTSMNVRQLPAVSSHPDHAAGQKRVHKSKRKGKGPDPKSLPGMSGQGIL